MDRLFSCFYCQRIFLFAAGEEQEVYNLKDASGTAKPCEHCRLIQKASKTARNNSILVSCSHCGLESRVPYRSANTDSVVCSKCLAESRK